MQWSKVVPAIQQDLNDFVVGKLSVKNLYKRAVSAGVGPEIRPFTRGKTNHGRKLAREALKRRNLLNG